jgi:Family of unknown function (DUF5759)
MLTVSDLKKQREIKANANHETYKMILETCYVKIRSKSDAGRNCVLFSLPLIIISRPLYNLNHACNYICRKLTRGKFKVSRIHDGLLFIEW